MFGRVFRHEFDVFIDICTGMRTDMCMDMEMQSLRCPTADVRPLYWRYTGMSDRVWFVWVG